MDGVIRNITNINIMIPKFIITIWKQWKCNHNFLYHRNIYGDEINYSGGCRTIYKCDKCDKFKYDREFKFKSTI